MGMLTVFDWVVIATYFSLLIGVVIWSSKKQDTSEDYFLAGRNIGWFAIGASLFASNIGSEHIVGLAGSGANDGMAMAHWELHAWIMLMLGWIFVPFYYSSGVFTMPEFLEKRFNARVRWILSLVSLAAYVLTKVSVTVYAGAIVFEVLLPDTFGSPQNAFWIGAFSTVILTGVYTVFGGFRAVLYTDTAQAIILLIGSASITYFGLKQLGGWGELVNFCESQKGSFQLWRPLAQEGIPWWKNGDFPWLGILIVSPIVGIWYWCTDQYIVQRTLAAKDLKTARRGAIWGGFLKVWPVFIFLVPGLIGAALHQKGVIQMTTLEDGVSFKGDEVFPNMVASLLPSGLRGLVVGGMLAALMSSLSSLFNSCASLFTVDIYEKIKPNCSEKELVKVGRVATCVVVVLGILWIPIMKVAAENEGLYKYLQGVQGYLAPPITATFLLGLFCDRVNSRGAVWGLSVGFLLGMFKLTIETFVSMGQVHSEALIAFGEFNFLYFSGVLFFISVVVILLVSMLTEAPKLEDIKGFTYSTVDKKMVRESYETVDIITSGIVLVFVFGVYAYFSFWI